MCLPSWDQSNLPMNTDLKGMVVIRSPPPQLVLFKQHRFVKQRLIMAIAATNAILASALGTVERLVSCSQ